MRLTFWKGKTVPKSTVIFDSAAYVACAMRDGSLIVQRKQTDRPQGVRIAPGESANAWAEAIRTALDASEAAALCRGVLQG